MIDYTLFYQVCYNTGFDWFYFHYWRHLKVAVFLYETKLRISDVVWD